MQRRAALTPYEGRAHMLRAKETFFTTSNLVVVAGDLVDDNDPIVKGREALFEPAEAAVKPSSVEQATAAPGERRSAVRTSKRG